MHWSSTSRLAPRPVALCSRPPTRAVATSGSSFTKPGAATITLTAGSITKTFDFTVTDAVDPYKVTVNTVAGAPGDVLIVTGTVSDGFGNPAGGRTVDLNTGTSTLGVLGNVAPTTNAAGVFSTTYTTGTNQSGTATLAATLRVAANNAAQTANATANAAWATAGVTIADGVYTASSKVTIAPDTVALNNMAPSGSVPAP